MSSVVIERKVEFLSPPGNVDSHQTKHGARDGCYSEGRLTWWWVPANIQTSPTSNVFDISKSKINRSCRPEKEKNGFLRVLAKTIDSIDYVHGIGNRRRFAHVQYKRTLSSVVLVAMAPKKSCYCLFADLSTFLTAYCLREYCVLDRKVKIYRSITIIAS